MTTNSAQGEGINLHPCQGCGALVPQVDGPMHRYLGASAGPTAHYAAARAMAETTWQVWADYQLQIAAWAKASGVS